MDLAQFWFQQSERSLVRTIFAKDNGTTTNENVNIQSLYTAEEWISEEPKTLNIEVGAVVGGTGGNVALQTGSGRGGTLTINNYGSIHGQGGSPSGGNGYNALQVDQAIILNNLGDIRAGGGSGGQGGQGGQGGNGSYTSTVEVGGGTTVCRTTTPTAEACNNSCTAVHGAGATCYSQVPGSGSICSVKTGVGCNPYSVYCQPGTLGFPGGCLKTTTTPTTGTAGGAGGAGGAGRGYNQSQGSGLAGVAGANPPTNAGRGGTGGTGGDGGDWASAGNPGGSGSPGANGTTSNGLAGSAGSDGGGGGLSITNGQLVELINEGIIAGEWRYAVMIFAANNNTSTNEEVNTGTLFSADQLSSSLPKLVTIEENAIVGSTTTANNAFNIPSGWAGGMYITNNGTIQGAGGAANSGNGGNALAAFNNGGLLVTVINNGTIQGGGGGGGKGGSGGQGGNGSVAGAYGYKGSGNVVTIPKNCTNSCTERWGSGARCYSQSTGQNLVDGPNCNFESFQSTYQCLQTTDILGTVDGGCQAATQTPTTGTAGGAGGNGGVGQGYNQSAGAGVGGTTGANPPTNAGRGGTGGTGGNGGAFGASGFAGATGATGANGNVSNGLAGSAGASGGLAGYSLFGTTYILLTNNGTLQGRT